MLLKEASDNFLLYLHSLNRSIGTVECYRKGIKQLTDFLEDKYNCPVYMEDIKMDDLICFFEMLKYKKSLSDSTRCRLLHTYKSFWNYAADKVGLCSKNIARLMEPVKVNNKEKIFITDSEANELFTAIKNPIAKVIVQTLYYTGLRISECLNLENSDVILSENVGFLYIRNAKGLKERKLPIGNKLANILNEYESIYQSNSVNKYYFHGTKSNKISPSFINKHLHIATKQLNWSKNVSAHILRHSFATRLIAGNIDISTIQRILGHSNIKTTSIYCHTDFDKLSGALELL
jgi:Site-specific recombinase XerD